MRFANDNKANALTLRNVMEMSDAEARGFIARIRWPETGGEPICPSCGSINHYVLSSRQKFKCKECDKQFSEMSGSCLDKAKDGIRFASQDDRDVRKMLANLDRGMAILQGESAP